MEETQVRDSAREYLIEWLIANSRPLYLEEVARNPTCVLCGERVIIQSAHRMLLNGHDGAQTVCNQCAHSKLCNF